MPFAEGWNGTAWKIEAVPRRAKADGSSLSAVSCVSPTACTAVGFYDDGAGRDDALAAVWNGTKWTTEAPVNGLGGSDLAAVSCISATSCTATGWQDTSNGPNNGFMFAEVSNGAKWTITLKKLTTPGALSGVSCTAATECIAVGDDGAEKWVTYTWNGTTWVAQLLSRTPGYVSSAVSCPSATSCKMVGSFMGVTQSPGWAESYDGTAWSNDTVAGPAPGSGIVDTFTAVSCGSATSCTAVGHSTYSPDGPSSDEVFAEAWNGTTWTVEPIPNPRSA